MQRNGSNCAAGSNLNKLSLKVTSCMMCHSYLLALVHVNTMQYSLGWFITQPRTNKAYFGGDTGFQKLLAICNRLYHHFFYVPVQLSFSLLNWCAKRMDYMNVFGFFLSDWRPYFIEEVSQRSGAQLATLTIWRTIFHLFLCLSIYFCKLGNLMTFKILNSNKRWPIGCK